MNQRDFSELRRRLNPDRRNPSVIRGCYVTHDGQVISTFPLPIGTRQIVLQFRQVKYLCSLSAWRAFAPCAPLRSFHQNCIQRLFSSRRRYTF